MKTLARPDDKAEILRRLQALRPDSTRRWGRMSVHQMVCHLADAYRMATGERLVIETSNPLGRTVVKWVALYLPVPWPSGVRTTPEIDQFRGGTAPSDFAADLAGVVALVEKITREAGSAAWPRHPVFGDMSIATWLRWGYLHADHHLRQFSA